jgi:hypothetical protein
MREARPHRPALNAAGAEAELLRDASEGRLNQDAVAVSRRLGPNRDEPLKSESAANPPETPA